MQSHTAVAGETVQPRGEPLVAALKLADLRGGFVMLARPIDLGSEHLDRPVEHVAVLGPEFHRHRTHEHGLAAKRLLVGREETPGRPLADVPGGRPRLVDRPAQTEPVQLRTEHVEAAVEPLGETFRVRELEIGDAFLPARLIQARGGQEQVEQRRGDEAVLLPGWSSMAEMPASTASSAVFWSPTIASASAFRRYSGLPGVQPSRACINSSAAFAPVRRSCSSPLCSSRSWTSRREGLPVPELRILEHLGGHTAVLVLRGQVGQGPRGDLLRHHV